MGKQKKQSAKTTEKNTAGAIVIATSEVAHHTLGVEGCLVCQDTGSNIPVTKTTTEHN